MLLFKCLRSNKGSSMIIFALALTALCGFGAISFDIGNLMLERQKLQNAIDSAVLAAAQELPDTVKAAQVAEQYIQLNGFKPSDVTVSFADSNSTINIKGSKTVNFYFAKVIGIDSKVTTCSAGATIDGSSGTTVRNPVGPAFDYVLFSGSTSTTLVINGSGCYVDGSSHTNASFVANGSKITITGACEAVKTITVNGSQIDIADREPGASNVPMPDFSDIIKAQAEKAGTLYNTNKTYNGSDIDVNSSIYVNGSITVNGSHFKGKGCILATGDITFNGSNLYDSSGDAVCFYSKSGNIIINGSNAELSGIVYAPNGSITLNGSNQTVHGRVIGRTLTFNGSGFTVAGTSNDLRSLPSTDPENPHPNGVRLVR